MLHPFGMVMPGRSFSATSQYRYGFNGQEKSDEIFKGSTTALYWEYDSRTGRRWNVDPVKNAAESEYSTFSNSPIFYSDPLGNTTVGPADWIKKKNADGSTSYKWDENAKNQKSTPKNYTYVGATGSYANTNYSSVSLYAKGNWSRSSTVSASSGSSNTEPPVQEAPSPTTAPLNIKPAPQATVSSKTYAFNNDFDRGMVEGNIATQGSVILLTGGTQYISAKLVSQSVAQFGVNGKNADVADIAINSFSPYGHANLYATAVVDWKPFSGKIVPQVIGINKEATKVALDLGLNYVFYGVGKMNNAVAPNLSSSQKLVVSTVNSVNKAVVKQVFSLGLYQAQTQKNVSESTKAPTINAPYIKK